MIDRRAWIAGAAFVIVGGSVLIYASGLLPVVSPPYRYRLSVEVDTPEGVKSGFSVIEVQWQRSGRNDPLAANAPSGDWYGEALAVDLGKRGILFALPRSENSTSWAKNVMSVAAPLPDGVKSIDANGERVTHAPGLHVIPRQFPYDGMNRYKESDPPSGYPILVRFRDIANPRTVEKVDPDQLNKSFGPGVKLRRITVELTDDPVTTGIEKRLGWLAALRNGGMLSGQQFFNNSNSAQNLSYNDFKQE